MTHLNQLEKTISSTLMDIIYEYEENLDSMKDLSDEELTKLIFESYLDNNWECKLCTLSKTMDRYRNFPGDSIAPLSLFVAAMEFAVNNIRWNLISAQQDIQEQISKLRATSK